MVRHTLEILQQMLQDFESVSDHFTTLRSKGLNLVFTHDTHGKENSHVKIHYSLFTVFSTRVYAHTWMGSSIYKPTNFMMFS